MCRDTLKVWALPAGSGGISTRANPSGDPEHLAGEVVRATGADCAVMIFERGDGGGRTRDKFRLECSQKKHALYPEALVLCTQFDSATEEQLLTVGDRHRLWDALLCVMSSP